MFRRQTWLCASLTVAAALALGEGGVLTAFAQPATNEFASGANVSIVDGCTLIAVQFNSRVQNVGFFPTRGGDILNVRVRRAEPSLPQQTASFPRQNVPFNVVAQSNVRDIAVSVIPGVGPTLRIQFNNTTTWDVGQSGSFTDILVATPSIGSSATCRVADILGRTAPSAPPDTVLRGGLQDAGLPPQRAGTASAADVKTIQASLDEARAAMAKKDYAQAERLLIKALGFPENPNTPIAIETLGEVRQLSGQTELARATFEEYLRRYPNSEAAPRIARQLGVPAPSATPGAAGPGGAPEKKNWSLTGSVSSFYVSDDSATQAKDISIAPNPNAASDSHFIHQRTILNNADIFGTIDGDEATTKFKFAGSFEAATTPGAADQYLAGISTAYISTTLKQTDLTLAIGRQSINDIGVIGRIDGVYGSWQANNIFRVSGVLGAENFSSYAPPLYNSRFVAAAAVDVANVYPGLDTSFFAIQQNDKYFVDSRSIGLNARYFQDNFSAIGLVDYDVLYDKLNAASLSGTYTFADKSILSVSADYQLTPYLSAWTALSGQAFQTIYDMIRTLPASKIYQFAIDNTPSFSSATVTYTKPLNDTWQVGLDAEVVKTTGLPQIDGTTPQGTEYFLAGTLTGSSVFKNGDLVLGALRYARLTDMNVYFVDLGIGYPVNDNLRVSPRLRAGVRQGWNPTLTEYTVLPEVLLDYYLTPTVTVESDVGYKYINTMSPGASGVTNDFFFTLGVTANLSSEGTAQCAGLLTPCTQAWLGGGVTPQQASLDSLYYGQGRARQGLSGFGAPSAAPDGPASPAVEAPVSTEAGLRYWLSTGHNKYDYFADTTTNDLVSTLDYASGPTSTGEAYFRTDFRQGLLRDVYIKGTIGGGRIGGGTLTDTDVPPFTDPGSKTVSTTSGDIGYWNLDVGYNVFTNNWVRVGAFAGIQQIKQSVNGFGCQQQATSLICAPALDSSLKVVTESDLWNSVRAGADVDVNLTEWLRWRNEVAFAATNLHTVDTHYLTFGRDPSHGDGGGFQLESALDFRISPQLTFGVGARWWQFNINTIDSFDQLLRYQTNRYGGFAEAAYRFY